MVRLGSAGAEVTRQRVVTLLRHVVRAFSCFRPMNLSLRPASRATATTAVLAVACLAWAGCVTVDEPSRAAPRTPAVSEPAPTPTPPAPSAADRAMAKAERDRVLHAYRAATEALRAGDFAAAKAKLDEAIVRIGGIIANDADAARARSLFSAESTKTFIGEPYERVMAYYYRGMLYWRDGEIDNARACFRSGQVIDSDPNAKQHDADYVLLDYLEGLATAKLGGDGSDAVKRAQARLSSRAVLPNPNLTANVLVFAEYGYGPRKVAAGPHGEQLRFVADESPSRSARLLLDEGRRIVPLPSYDDLGFQATTRGGRVMDHILGNKAVFKTGANAVGDLAFAGSVIAADESRRRKRENKDNDAADAAAVGLGVVGLIGKIASAAANPVADTRQWDALPQHLSFAALQLAPGDYMGKLEFLDRDGAVLAQRTQPLRISVQSGGRDTVVFLSEL